MLSGPNDNNEWKYLGYSREQLKALGINIASKGGLAALTHVPFLVSLTQIVSAKQLEPLTARQAFNQIIAKKGYRGLTYAIEPGILREAGKTAIKGPIQVKAAEYANKLFPNSEIAQGFGIGLASGTLPAGLLQPIERYKIYAATQDKPITFTKYLKLIWEQQNGPYSAKLHGSMQEIYRAYYITASKEVLMNSTAFIMLPIAKKLLEPYRRKGNEKHIDLLASIISGVTTAGVASPLDLAKNYAQMKTGDKKTMIQNFSELYQAAYEKAQRKAAKKPEISTNKLIASVGNAIFKMDVARNVARRLFVGVPIKAGLTALSYTVTTYILGPFIGSGAHGKPPALPPSESSTPPSRLREDPPIPSPAEQKSLLTRFNISRKGFFTNEEDGLEKEDLQTLDELSDSISRLTINS